MRLKVDENLPVDVAELLRQHGHDALTVTEQKLNGQPDPIVAQVCRAEQRALLTLDLDFSDLRADPPENQAGIIVLRPDHQSRQSVLQLVQRLLPLMEQETLAGLLWIVDERRVRIRGAAQPNPIPKP